MHLVQNSKLCSVDFSFGENDHHNSHPNCKIQIKPKEELESGTETNDTTTTSYVGKEERLFKSCGCINKLKRLQTCYNHEVISNTKQIATADG